MLRSFFLKRYFPIVRKACVALTVATATVVFVGTSAFGGNIASITLGESTDALGNSTNVPDRDSAKKGLELNDLDTFIYINEQSDKDYGISNPYSAVPNFSAHHKITVGGGSGTLHINKTGGDNSAIRMDAGVPEAFGLTIDGHLDIMATGCHILTSDGVVFVCEQDDNPEDVYLTVTGDMKTTVTNSQISLSKFGSYGVGVAEGDFTVGGDFSLDMSNITYALPSGGETVSNKPAILTGLMLGGGMVADSPEIQSKTTYLFNKSLTISKVELVDNKENPDFRLTEYVSATGVLLDSYACDTGWNDVDSFEREMLVKENLTIQHVSVNTKGTAWAEAYGISVFGKTASVTVEGETVITDISATTAGEDYYAAAVDVNDGAEVNLNGDVTIARVTVNGSKEGAFSLAVNSGGTVNINTAESAEKTIVIEGDTLTRDSGSVINMNLCNEESSFTGYTYDKPVEAIADGATVADPVNATNIHLCNGARWYVPGTNHLVGTLTADDMGHVYMPEPGETPTTLTVDNLCGGGGIFHMNVDTSTATGDQLVIGNGTGTYTLMINNVGTTSNGEDILVVTQQSGDATFTLGKEVKVGNYIYTLKTVSGEEGDLTYLTPGAQPAGPGGGPELTNTALAVLSFAGYGPHYAAYQSSVSNLRSRLGEVRGRMAQEKWLSCKEELSGKEELTYGERKSSNVWAQLHTLKDRMDSYTGTALKQTSTSVALGYDVMPNENWIVGVGLSAGIHDQHTSVRSHRVSGDANSFFLHAYGTWLRENGLYVDLVATVGAYDQEFRMFRPQAETMSGDYTDWCAGVSAEVGRKYTDARGVWFVEPQAQLSVWSVFADDYTNNEGGKVDRDNTTAVTGRLGVVGGRAFTFAGGKKGLWYVKAGVIHEFCGEQDTKLNGEHFSEDSILGSRIYYGIGAEAELRDNLHLYGEIGREEGAHYTREYDVRGGIKFVY